MEVNEMDFTSITNNTYSVQRPIDYTDSYPGKRIGEKNQEVPYAIPKEHSEGAKLREEAMMNLQEVQNFLYMLIGSKLRIKTDHSTPGSTVNTCV